MTGGTERRCLQDRGSGNLLSLEVLQTNPFFASLFTQTALTLIGMILALVLH